MTPAAPNRDPLDRIRALTARASELQSANRGRDVEPAPRSFSRVETPAPRPRKSAKWMDAGAAWQGANWVAQARADLARIDAMHRLSGLPHPGGPAADHHCAPEAQVGGIPSLDTSATSASGEDEADGHSAPTLYDSPERSTVDGSYPATATTSDLPADGAARGPSEPKDGMYAAGEPDRSEPAGPGVSNLSAALPRHRPTRTPTNVGRAGDHRRPVRSRMSRAAEKKARPAAYSAHAWGRRGATTRGGAGPTPAGRPDVYRLGGGPRRETGRRATCRGPP